MGDPLNVRLTGIAIDQPDLPHWATSILNWLGMVSAMQQATGEVGRIYGALLEQALESGAPAQYVNTRTGKASWLSGPSAVYGIYQQFCIKVKEESNKS